MEICKHLAIENMNKKLCYEKDGIVCDRYYLKKICESELSKLKPVEYHNTKKTIKDFL